MTSMFVTKERAYSPHHTLLGAARVCLGLAEAKQPGSHYHEFTAMVMSALSLEALANSVGSRLITDWGDFECSSPWAKLRTICETLRLDFDRNKEPWSTARWLCGFRNKVAHGKPQDLLLTKRVPEEAYETEMRSPLDSWIESQISLGNAKRAYKAASDIKLAFSQALPDELKLGIYADSTMFTGESG